MQKRLKKWVIAAAVFVAVAAVGITLAFMFKKANVKNTFVWLLPAIQPSFKVISGYTDGSAPVTLPSASAK